MRSKRFEALDARPVKKDGFVKEWPEVGLIAMNNPGDPTPSLKIENGVIVEMDGKARAEFDMLDTFIANYGIRTEKAQEYMAMDSLEIARMLCDIKYQEQLLQTLLLPLLLLKLPKFQVT